MRKPKADPSFGDIRHPKKRAFLAAYAELGTITHAAKAAGIHRSTHTNWIADDGEYKEAFEEAGLHACDALEKEARRRAVEGYEEPVYQKGELVGTIRKYSDTLLIFLMKGAMPEKYKERSQVNHTMSLDELLAQVPKVPNPRFQVPEGKN